MSIFDPFKQSKLQGAYSKLRDTKLPEKEMSLDDLKRLSGSGKITGEHSYKSLQDIHELAHKKQQYMRENNIRPGDQAWFKLIFAKPDITGEDPFSKS